MGNKMKIAILGIILSTSAITVAITMPLAMHIDHVNQARSHTEGYDHALKDVMKSALACRKQEAADYDKTHKYPPYDPCQSLVSFYFHHQDGETYDNTGKIYRPVMEQDDGDDLFAHLSNYHDLMQQPH